MDIRSLQVLYSAFKQEDNKQIQQVLKSEPCPPFAEGSLLHISRMGFQIHIGLLYAGAGHTQRELWRLSESAEIEEGLESRML